MSSKGPLRQLTWVRLILFTREPEAIFWVFLFPVVLALVLSFAFKNRGHESIPIGVIQGTTDSAWTEALQKTDGLKVRVYTDHEEAERKLGRGAIAALVLGNDPPEVRYDPTRSEAITAELRVSDAIQRAAGRTDPVAVHLDEVTEHGSRYIDFLIPGILGMNLMGTGIWGTGFAVVDMRQKKLLKRFLVTPMRKTDFLLAQMGSRLIFLVMEVVVITVFGVLLLGVPFRGSVIEFSIACLAGTLCFSGLGLLIAARPQTLEGVSGLMNFVMMPMWLLSGVFFSYEHFPAVFYPAIRLLPLTALNDALRTLMLEGTVGPAFLGQLAVILGWGAVSFFVALRIFRWQ
jgi:ABC-2 type transport system permease protein